MSDAGRPIDTGELHYVPDHIYERYMGLYRQQAALLDIEQYFRDQGLAELAEEVAQIREAVKLERNLLLEKVLGEGESGE